MGTVSLRQAAHAESFTTVPSARTCTNSTTCMYQRIVTVVPDARCAEVPGAPAADGAADQRRAPTRDGSRRPVGRSAELISCEPS